MVFLKKNLVLKLTRRSSRIKNLDVQEVVIFEDDEIEDVISEDVILEYVIPEDDDVAGEYKEDDKEDFEKDGEVCLIG